MLTLSNEVVAHVVEVFDYLGDVLETISIERLTADVPDTGAGLIPTAPEVATLAAYVVEMRARTGDTWQPGDALMVFRTAELPWPMETSSTLQRADGRRYSVVGFDTTTRALTVVEARRA